MPTIGDLTIARSTSSLATVSGGALPGAAAARGARRRQQAARSVSWPALRQHDVGPLRDRRPCAGADLTPSLLELELGELVLAHQVRGSCLNLVLESIMVRSRSEAVTSQREQLSRH